MNLSTKTLTMEIKITPNGYVKVTMYPDEALARLLPNVYGEDKEMVLTETMYPLVFYIKGITAQDLLRLQKEAEYRNGPLWDRMIDTNELTPRLKSLLGIMGIDTFGQLISNKRVNFLKYRNVGKKTLSEIEDLLYKHGLEFIG